MKKLFVAAALSTALAGSAAHAAVVVKVAQTGADVTTTVTGNINLAGLSVVGSGLLAPGLRGASSYVAVGSNNQVFAYGLSSGSRTFGTSETFYGADSTSGSTFGIMPSYAGIGAFFLAKNYVSGSALENITVFTNQTIATLGLTAGQYVYTSAGETITLNIAPDAIAAVPEPATWTMLLAGFGLVGAGLRSRRVRFAGAAA